MPVARSSFSVGGGRIVRAGEKVAGDDPVISGREHLFDREVEQATAAPGEKRNVKIPDGTCRGTTKAGDPCSNVAGDGGFCRHHGDDR